MLYRLARAKQPLWSWLRRTTSVSSLGAALEAAEVLAETPTALFSDEDARRLGLSEFVTRSSELGEEVTFHFLTTLAKPVRVAAIPKANLSMPKQAGTRPIYKRTPPDPLPIEPYFQKIPGSEAFLHAIAEEPMEDVHRLALADWLDDAGHHARAEFIRLQCRREQLPEFHAARGWFDAQIEALFEANGAMWTAGLPAVEGIRWADQESFHRGMLETLSISSAGTPVAAYPDLFASIDVRRLGIRLYERPQLEGWLNLASPPRLVHFDPQLSSDTFQNDLPTFADSPACDHLYSLSVCECYLRELDTRGHPLLDRIPLSELQSLFVAYPGDLPLEADLPRLVDLYVNHATHHDLASLTSWPLLEQIAALTIKSEAYCLALGNSPSIGSLRELNLKSTRIGIEGARAIAKAESLKSLQALSVFRHTPNQGVKAIARSRYLSNLQVFCMDDNASLTEQGVKFLADDSCTFELRALRLAWSRFGPAGALALASSKRMANLEALDLLYSQIDHVGAKALANSQVLEKLTYLDLRGNDLTDKAKDAIRERFPLALL